MPKDKNTKKDEKWDFSDYAFTFTGILVGVLLIVPDFLESQFGISILGGSLADAAPYIADSLQESGWSFNELRALSPLLFLLTTTVVFFKEAIDARKDGGYEGSLFTHTFESLLEDAIYMAITTVMVYSAVLLGAMYISWLAGPITWILFIVIFPLVRRKGSGEKADIPRLLLLIFVVGIVAEVLTGAWVAFPLSWLIICVFKFVGAVKVKISTVDEVFDVLYYAFSIVLMALGIGFGMWITSWLAFPVAFFICWIVSKFGRFKKLKA